MKEKRLAALLSAVSNGTLIILKLVVGVTTNSISIISEAVHSGSDLLASFIAFYSVSKSEKPADKDHSFGHGKYEDLSGLLEGALIIGAAIFIIFEAMKKIFCGTGEQLDTTLGLIVMLISVLANCIVSAYLFKIAKKTDSMALFADAEHLRTDIFASVAVFIGLLAVKFTGYVILDSVVAIVVALIIFTAGFKVCENSANNLLDRSLDDETNMKIKDIVSSHFGDEIRSIKSLKTRKSGVIKNIEITLCVNKQMHISTSHKLCDILEKEIEDAIHHTDITIHLEPDC